MKFRQKLTDNLSQNEYPNLKIFTNYIQVSGYQSFDINSENVYNPKRKLKKKSKLITEFIDNNQKLNSMIDIGCSQGYYSFYSYFKNMKVNLIEHDPEYVKQLTFIKTHLNLDINILNNKFSENTNLKADIVLFLALIHWVYNSTDSFKNLKDIINKLYTMTNKVLIIEWIDLSDQAITSTDRIIQSEKDTDKYNKKNFISALQIFTKIEKKESDNKTRELYFCYI